MSLILEQFNPDVPVTHQSYIPTLTSEHDLFPLPEGDGLGFSDEFNVGTDGVGDSESGDVPFEQSPLAFAIVMLCIIGFTLGRNKIRNVIYGN